MKYEVVYEIRVKRVVLVEAETKEDALYAVQNGKVGGDVDLEEVESRDIVGCEAQE